MTRQPYVPREPRENKVWIVPANFDAPRPGFYRTRLVKGGQWVPVQLLFLDGPRDEDGQLIGDCIYNLRIDDEPANWRTHLGLTGEPISAEEYDYLLRTRAHDRQYEPVLADARQPIDHLKTPITF